MSSQTDTKPGEYCPLAEAALMLNSKWDMIVIYNLLDEGLRFSELKEKISQGITKPITSSSLTRILRKLEGKELLERDVSAELGESVEITYQLTRKGKALEVTIRELKKWGTEFLS